MDMNTMDISILKQMEMNINNKIKNIDNDNKNNNT